MTPDHKNEICDSWQQLVPHADELITRFYDRLFEINPGSRVLFVRTDSLSMQRKFLEMLDEIVRLCEDPDRLVRVVAPLGRRHAEYGVQASDYDDAGAALIWAIHEILGDQFSDEAAEAWRELYHMLSGVMQRASRVAADPV